MSVTTPAPGSRLPAPSRSYPDFHDHLRILEEQGLLVRVREPINKDSEMHPLVRWQFRGGIPEHERKAFLFENVVDGSGRRYDMPVAVGALATNREIYRLGMGCPLDEINARWSEAIARPLEPVIVDDAPCQEIVIQGADLERPGMALDGLPVPISTPGWDISPYITAGQFITKDPDTGVQNVGNYRGQIKAPRRLGMNPSIELRPGILLHWNKHRQRGTKLPCAVAIGIPPVVSFAAVQKVPEHLDELAVAGGLLGTPLNVVRAKTVDLLVPAEAEVVIEGFIDTEWLEPEAPFGESHGYVNLQEYNAFMDVTCITRRHDAIFASIISQVTPSESSLIKRVALEAVLLEHLQVGLAVKGIKRVVMHEPLTNLRKVVAVVFERGQPQTEIWRALYGLAAVQRSIGKLIVAVDDDIDPDNADALLWALSYRMKPHLDMQVLEHKDGGHGPRDRTGGDEDSAILFNATLKHDFPPVSLPKRPYMERARELWEKLGLPPLKPESPWYGYSLGDWSEEFDEFAERAVQGRYFETGEIIAQRRRNDVEINTQVSDLE
ncbi:MAG TPA: UbiD family decarboxylase [Chloroflexota bacterium]|nr:UbiD family decarboxylase [Chloroflexota bacterium]